MGRGSNGSNGFCKELKAAGLGGQLAVMFHGTAEWALDHVLVAELVWPPTETQLRELLEQRHLGEPEPVLQLTSTTDGYWCEIRWQRERLRFEAFGAAEAYATALLHVLQHQNPDEGEDV